MPHSTDLLQLSQELLDAADTGDWDAYSELCDSSLTAFEPEAVGHLVAGIDFHRFYFDGTPPGSRQRSTIVSPQVRMLGDAAVVTYARLVQKAGSDGKPATISFEETRVWQRQDGVWRHVHFHRSRTGEWQS